ncbi:hypothetical protein [Psittacicella hinzii]|uniref:hypothetical protein n=1 Tax=Psittacicella hinzii TaxID=2028575 RepID=UPI0011C36ECB|nr:hypothetical protein [Psittacicella hinzii]
MSFSKILRGIWRYSAVVVKPIIALYLALTLLHMSHSSSHYFMQKYTATTCPQPAQVKFASSDKEQVAPSQNALPNNKPPC